MGETASKERRPISAQREIGIDATTLDIQERPQYRLVSPPPEEFTCSICTELLFDPVEISTCDHLFCRKCVTDWLKRSRTCPECRTPATFLRDANRNLRNFLANLSVHCPEEFCDDIITIAELEQHVKTCRNVQTLCEKGCEQLLLKSERKHHDCLQKLKHLLLEERTHGKDRMIQQKDTIIQELQKVINDQAKTMKEHEEILDAALRNFQWKNGLLIEKNESLVAHIKNLEDETSALRLQNENLKQAMQRNEREVMNLNATNVNQQKNAADNVRKEKEKFGNEAGEFKTDKKTHFVFRTRIREDMNDNAKITSPPFEAHGFIWNVIVGRTSSHLSLFISSDPKDSKKAPKLWKVNRFHLRLRREGWALPKTFTQYEEIFTMNSRVKGFENFCKWKKLRGFEEENINIELMISEVSIPINASPVQYSTSGMCPVSIGYRFYDLKEIKENDEAYSHNFLIEGELWKLMVKKSAGNLHVYIMCSNKEANPSWMESSDFSFELKNHNGKATWVWDDFNGESTLKIGGNFCPWQLVQHEKSFGIDFYCEKLTDETTASNGTE